MATCCIPRDLLSWFVVGARRILLSACTVALVSCGGGQSGPAASVDSVGPRPAPTPAPGAPPAPAQLVVGTAMSIDGGASGTPLDLRVTRSANGDGFAVWRADNGTIVPGGGSRHDLWANRYSAVTAAWGSPISIRAGGADKVIPDFDLVVDASGNATVAWTELIEGGPEISSRVVMSTRFDAGAGSWSAPVLLNANGGGARLASDASGALLAVYGVTVGVPNVDLVGRVRGRFFDLVGGNWQPEAAIDRSFGSNGSPIASLDGSGNALTVFNGGSEGTRSNYYSLNVGIWGQLASGETVPDVEIPGSGNMNLDSLQLAASTDGNFLLAWDSFHGVSSFDPSDLRIARFTSRAGTWSEAQTLVQGGGQNTQFPNIQLQRMGSDARGTTLVLWTQIVGGRSAVLKAVGLDPAGATCSVVQVIDRAVGGFAARADLAVDPQGNAMAIWQQFEGPNRPDDGARSNIAINRFERAHGTWASAVLAETQPGNATSPRASAAGGQALLGWIQEEGGVNRVKALLQPLADTPGR
jgi:hypothetical protein